MNKVVVAAIASSLIVLTGCKSTGKQANNITHLNLEPFKITLPKDIDAKLASVSFFLEKKHLRTTDASSEYFEQYQAKLPSPNQLALSGCFASYSRQTGMGYRSCEKYHAIAKGITAESSNTLTITPSHLEREQGRMLFIPIKFPNTTTDDYLHWLARHNVTSPKNEVKSKYSVEATRSNFERRLSKEWNALPTTHTTQQLLKQYKDVYLVELSESMNAVIAAKFFPYRDGSIVNYQLVGISLPSNSKHVDWNKGFKQANQIINEIINL